MQAAAAKINLILAKVAQLRGAEVVVVCNQDHCRIAVLGRDRLRAVSPRGSLSFSVKDSYQGPYCADGGLHSTGRRPKRRDCIYPTSV
jgi:hypothetical protein